jgi:hypothetical protein
MSSSIITPCECTEDRIIDDYLRAIDTVQDARFDQLELDFVAVADQFSRRHEISYAAWLDVGVAEHVLTAAGILPRPSERRARTGAGARRIATSRRRP